MFRSIRWLPRIPVWHSAPCRPTHKLERTGEHDLYKNGERFDREGVWSDTIFADEAIRYIKDESEKPDLLDTARRIALILYQADKVTNNPDQEA